MSKNEDLLNNIDGRCNCLAARQASRFLTAVYDQALAPVELRITQFSILHKLVDLGALVMGDLAARMAMDRTTLSANLKPLQRDGLIEMRAGKDRRVREVLVTKDGIARYKNALPLWWTVQNKFEDSYGNTPAAELRDAMRAVLRTGFEPWEYGENDTRK